MKYKHRKSPFIETAMTKVTWLRTRTSDPEVVETLDVIVEALTRIDARLRVLEGNTESKLGILGGRMRRLEEEKELGL